MATSTEWFSVGAISKIKCNRLNKNLFHTVCSGNGEEFKYPIPQYESFPKKIA